MTASDVSAPSSRHVIRDRYYSPSILAPFAEDMARRLSRISIGPLLEICADTGLLTQAIASAMSASLTIIATDPNADAIGHACTKPGLARVTWQVADPKALPFPDATFGIVACHFGLAALQDRLPTFQEARRVMKSGGRFVFSLPAHIRYNPIAECIQAAMDAYFPADPPTFVGHTLHGHTDTESIDDDLTAAGFTDAIYTSVELPYAATSARDIAIGYCLGTPLQTEIEFRAPGEVGQVMQATAMALERRFGSGTISSAMRAHVVSAAG